MVMSTFKNYMMSMTFTCKVGLQDVHQAFFSRLPSRAREKFAPFEQVGFHVGYNMKQGNWTRCFNKLNFSEDQVHVVHWSGKRKPRRSGYSDGVEPLQNRALKQYMDALCLRASVMNVTAPACGPEPPSHYPRSLGTPTL